MLKVCSQFPKEYFTYASFRLCKGIKLQIPDSNGLKYSWRLRLLIKNPVVLGNFLVTREELYNDTGLKKPKRNYKTLPPENKAQKYFKMPNIAMFHIHCQVLLIAFNKVYITV